MPFLFFGVVCLVLSVWMYATNPVRNDPIPIWILLVGIGMIALVGGLVGALLAADEEEVPEPAPRRDVAPTPAPEEYPDPAPERRWEPRAPRFAASRPGPPAPRVARSPARPVGAAPEPEPTVPMPAAAVGAAGFSEATGPLPFLPGTGAAGRDETLESLDELSSFLQAPRPVRPSPRAAAPTSIPPPNGATAKGCAGCDGHLPSGGAAALCRGCGLPLCADCAGAAESAGHGALCPTCTTLEEVSVGVRAS